MECDSTESSTVNISETSAAKLPLAIYQVSDGSHPYTGCFGRSILSDQLWFLPLQPAERTVPDWKGHNLSGGLPGDQHHSTILDQGPGQIYTAVKKRSLTVSFDTNKNALDYDEEFD